MCIVTWETKALVTKSVSSEDEPRTDLINNVQRGLLLIQHKSVTPSLAITAHCTLCTQQ